MTYTISSWPSDSYWVYRRMMSIFKASGLLTKRQFHNLFQRSLALELQVPVSQVYDLTVSESIKTTIQREYLRADIYYKTLDVKLISEGAKYTVREREEL